MKLGIWRDLWSKRSDWWRSRASCIQRPRHEHVRKTNDIHTQKWSSNIKHVDKATACWQDRVEANESLGSLGWNGKHALGPHFGRLTICMRLATINVDINSFSIIPPFVRRTMSSTMPCVAPILSKTTTSAAKLSSVTLSVTKHDHFGEF